MNLLRQIDIDNVIENIDDIVEKANIKKINTLEPTIIEYKDIIKIILNYIKKEKRIIYGGYAWNTLIKIKNKNDTFYKDTDFNDIEFYSNKPIDDLKNICDLLYNKNFKYITGKSGQHDNTYKIFVNFVNYLDITYMPSNIFYTVKTIKIDGINYIDPSFIFVDLLRVFSDPLTSYWRLDKNILRGNLLIKHYPLNFNREYKKEKLSKDTISYIHYLFPILAELKTIIFIGDIAYNAFINYNDDTILFNNNSIELISNSITKDVSKIYNILFKYFIDKNDADNFNNNIIVEQYYPFFQFTDKKIIFKNKKEVFLTIYNNNERCNPFNISSININNNIYKINIGTFNLVLLYNLILYHQSFADKNNLLQDKQEYIINNLIKARNIYLTNSNKTILDNTIFQDFKSDCLGETIDFMRKYQLKIKNKKFSKSFIPPYDPDNEKFILSGADYKFDNTSGNIINNPKDMIFNIKNHG